MHFQEVSTYFTNRFQFAKNLCITFINFIIKCINFYQLKHFYNLHFNYNYFISVGQLKNGNYEAHNLQKRADSPKGLESQLFFNL